MNDAIITACTILISAGLFIAFVGMMLLFLYTDSDPISPVECPCSLSQNSINEVTSRLDRIEGFIDAYLTMPPLDTEP